MTNNTQMVSVPRELLDVLRFWLERSAEKSEAGELKELFQLRELLRTAPAEDVRAAGDEPVSLRHMAVAENGVLRWMTGRKMQECELYALPDGGAMRDKLYRHPQRPVVLPMYCLYLRGVVPHNRAEVEAHKDGWNACIDEFKRLNP